MTAATPALPAPHETGGERGTLRSRLLTVALVLPAGLWYLVLLVAPLALVVLFSFGERGRTGGYAGGFTTENYANAFRNADPFITSLQLSIVGTALC